MEKLQFKNKFNTNEFIDEFNQIIHEKLFADNKSVSNEQGEDFLKQFDKQFLTNVRVYWNNYRCVLFWKFYVEELNKLKRNSGESLSSFFIKLNKDKLNYTVEPLNYELLNNKKILNKYQYNKKSFNDKLKIFFYKKQSKQNNLIFELTQKLIAVKMIQRESILNLYAVFLHRNDNNEFITKIYTILKLLDNCLFVDNNNHIFTSPFDRIFFSTNVDSLITFFQYLINKNLKLSYVGVEDFLKRQTIFNRKRALTIPFEENQMENLYSGLSKYDESLQVVRIKQYPIKEFLEQRHNKEAFDIKSTGGCPFAKSKGVEKNSFLEHYEYFNNLFLQYLKHSPEFKELLLEK